MRTFTDASISFRSSTSPTSASPIRNQALSPPVKSYQITSPVLAALGDLGRMDLDTTAWASNVPVGTSPPNRPLPSANQFESRPTSSSPFAGEELRGGFSKTPPSTSPKLAYRLPARRTSGYQGPADYTASSPRGRPNSMPAHYPNMNPPPLPYAQQQLHSRRPGDRGYLQSRSASRRTVSEEFVSFDTLGTAGDEATLSISDALVVASGPRLDVYRVEKEKLASVGFIEGLRGAVVAARILPCGLLNDPLRPRRPLVAVIVHGLMLGPSPHHSRPGSSHSSEFDPSASTVQALHTADAAAQPTNLYQTSVEVYSLRDRSHVATLFKSPAAEVEPVPGERFPEPPPPIGDLSIQASGRFVVLTSGESGEVWIYEATKDPEAPPFRCIGKTWTTIPSHKSRTWSSSSAASEPESPGDGAANRRPKVELGIVSVSHRWLAIAPPPPSSKTTMHGRIPLPMPVKPPPGFSTHTSSLQPSITCELDTPLEESRFNKVARDVTQEVIKGARWVGDQGMTAWKNYWNRPAESNPYDPAPPQAPQPQFPPTHAPNDNLRSPDQAAIISVLDLEKLSQSQDAKAEVALNPIATFPLSSGCSFISFNPNGLALLTASAKGDVQYVWDLMRMVHGNHSLSRAAATDAAANSGPTVRQIAVFTRVTVAKIRDVVWAEPHGERLAIVTDRGTVHVHDLPPSALQWPPPAPTLRAPASPVSPEPEMTQNPNPPRGWGAALTSFSSNAQPFLSAVRQNPLANFGQLNLAQASAGATAVSGKLVAAGVTKAGTAAAGTVRAVRHRGDNRLSLAEPLRADVRGAVRWLRGGKASGGGPALLGVASGGLLRTHSVRTSPVLKGGQRRPSVVGPKVAELSLPAAPPPDAPPRPNSGGDGFTSATTAPAAPPAGDAGALRGRWPALPPRRPHEPAQPLAHAEIETCAPYPPFHTDRRVALRVLRDAQALLHEDTGAWVFGEEIPVDAPGSGVLPERRAEPDDAEELAHEDVGGGGVGLEPLDVEVDALGGGDGDAMGGGEGGVDLLGGLDEPGGPIESVVRERPAGADGERQVTITTRRKKEKKSKKKAWQHVEEPASAPAFGGFDGAEDFEGQEALMDWPADL